MIDETMDMEETEMMQTKLKVMFTGLCCFLIFSASLSLNRPVRASEFAADITTQIMNNNATGRIYVSNTRYRMDLNVQDEKFEKGPIILVDRAKGRTILLNPNTNTYEEFENFSFRAHMIDPFQAITYLEKNVEKRKVGAETVAGYVCDHHAFYDQGFKLADVWFAGKLHAFPIKAHIVSGRDNGNIKVKTNIGDTKLELSHIKEQPIDVALFNVPREFAKAEGPEAPRKKTMHSESAITETAKGTAPWGRRIGKGGEIQVRVDPKRPIKIVFNNLVEESTCTYSILPEGGAQDAAKSNQVVVKRWQKKEIKIDKNKKIGWVFIRVDRGLVFAAVTNETDPFAFDRDKKIQEGYLHLSVLGSMGICVDPARPLTITVTGDSQDAPESEVSVKCCRDSYKDKAFEKTCRIANGTTETWKFTPDQQIRTCEISIGKMGGIKYKTEQPALPEQEKPSQKPGKTSAKTKTPPKVVYTTPTTSYGSSKKITHKNTGSGLSKAETGKVLKALNSGNVATIKACLDEGMDPNALISGSPLLQKAANLSSAEMVKLIISRGGDLRYKDRSGNDALSQAQSNNRYYQEIIPVLVEAGVPVDRDTPIWKIAFKTQGGKFKPGVKATLEYLLLKGADVNTPISKTGNTLLMFAAKMAWLEPVEFYLAHGADVNARDKNGNSTLSWAKTERRGEEPYEKQNRKAIIELLKSRGAQ